MSSINVKPVGNPVNEYLGAGAIYYGGDADPNDWATGTPPTLLGTTKGGSSFSDNAEFRENDADGNYFPSKNGRDLVKMMPQLTVNMLTISTANLEKYYAGMATTTGTTYDTVIRSFDLSNSYTDHIWFVGQNRDGKDIIIRIDNALGDQPFASSHTKDEEIVLNTIFTAHMDASTIDYTDPTTFPYAVFLEK